MIARANLRLASVRHLLWSELPTRAGEDERYAALGEGKMVGAVIEADHAIWIVLHFPTLLGKFALEMVL